MHTGADSQLCPLVCVHSCVAQMLKDQRRELPSFFMKTGEGSLETLISKAFKLMAKTMLPPVMKKFHLITITENV